MNASIGDFFPNKDKLDFAKRNVIPGKVILCRSDIADKDKRLVIIGVSGDKKRVATLLFNTIKYFTKNARLSSLEIFFNANGREYLDHDSYLSCIKIESIPYQRIFDRLVTNPEDLKGTMNKNDLDSACTTAANSHTAIKKDLRDFGLSAYLLQKKP